jgi:hypothetical protein
MKYYYTIYGFLYDGTDPHDSVARRTIKVCLRTHLPVLRPMIAHKICEGFDLQMAHGKVINGKEVELVLWRCLRIC